MYSYNTVIDLMRFIVEILRYENYSKASKTKYCRVFFSCYKLITKVSISLLFLYM